MELSHIHLAVLTLKFLALKNWVFPRKKILPKKFLIFLPLFYATCQCGRYNVFKKKLNLFFPHENIKKWASKVAHNWP